MNRVVAQAMFTLGCMLMLAHQANALESTSVSVRGKIIRVGDTADNVFSVLKQADMVKQDVKPDAAHPGSLFLTKYYKTNGTTFTLSFARQGGAGPYVVTKVSIDGVAAKTPKGQANEKASASALSIALFERSVFLQKYKPTSKENWGLNTGGKTFNYSFSDPENADSSRSIGMSSDPTNLTKMSLSWNGKSTLAPAKFTKVKEEFLRDLLASTYPSIKANDLIEYVGQQQGRNYPGGGNTMPRKQLAGAAVQCGTVGETLIVSVEINASNTRGAYSN
jgi:hypothetical protein